MDKILSARLDEEVVGLLDALSRKLGRSKKAILEDALRSYAEGTGRETVFDALGESFGAWRRSETASATVRRARKAFRDSLDRRAR